MNTLCVDEMDTGINGSLQLPLELLFYIAELAASSDMSTAFNLCLVSRTLKAFVIPVLYTSITLPTKECIKRFISCVETAQSSSVDPTRHTHRLCIHRNAMHYFDWTLSLLRNSPLEHILLCPSFGQLPEQEDAEGTELWPHPWHAMVLYVPKLWLKDRIVLFSKTTHLYLDNGINPEVVNLCMNLPLTHVGMGFWGDSDDPAELLAAVEAFLSMKSIQILSIHALISGAPIDDFYGGVWSILADNMDERLVVRPGLARDQLIEVFESGRTIWERIDEFKHWREIV